MRTILGVALACGVAVAVLAVGRAPAAAVGADGAGPRVPDAVLGPALGAYLTVEGERVNAPLAGKRTFLIDTVNGEKLATPIKMWVSGLDLPDTGRVVLKGYESGSMVGTPPAVIEAARERGKAVAAGQAAWAWRPKFVPLIAVQPAGLVIPAEGDE